MSNTRERQYDSVDRQFLDTLMRACFGTLMVPQELLMTSFTSDGFVNDRLKNKSAEPFFTCAFCIRLREMFQRAVIEDVYPIERRQAISNCILLVMSDYGCSGFEFLVNTGEEDKLSQRRRRMVVTLLSLLFITRSRIKEDLPDREIAIKAKMNGFARAFERDLFSISTEVRSEAHMHVNRERMPDGFLNFVIDDSYAFEALLDLNQFTSISYLNAKTTSKAVKALMKGLEIKSRRDYISHDEEHRIWGYLIEKHQNGICVDEIVRRGLKEGLFSNYGVETDVVMRYYVTMMEDVGEGLNHEIKKNFKLSQDGQN